MPKYLKQNEKGIKIKFNLGYNHSAIITSFFLLTREEVSLLNVFKLLRIDLS